LPCRAPLVAGDCHAPSDKPALCQCPLGGKAFACFDDEEPLRPISRCSLGSEPPPGTPRLSLFVAGLNHDTHVAMRTVRRKGIVELRDAIVGALPNTLQENLVVAFSASSTIGKEPIAGAIGEPCDEGAYASAGPGMNHAACLANMLDEAYLPVGRPAPKFHVVEWEGNPGSGGLALLTGWFWEPIEVERVMIPKMRGYTCPDRNDGCCSDVLGVRLRSRTPADTPWQIVVYVAHTRGGVYESDKQTAANCPSWDPAKAITPMSSVGDIQAIRDYAKAHERLGDLPPILAGDFNWSYADQIVNAALPQFAAVDNGLTCAGSDKSLGFENDIMHVFLGRMTSAEAPDAFISQHARQVVNYLRPVSVRYTSNPDGTPDQTPRGVGQSYKPGIDLPHVAHNVVALDFEVVTENHPPPNCNCNASDTTTNPGAFLVILALSRQRRRARLRRS
jgi:hypothetical protein